MEIEISSELKQSLEKAVKDLGLTEKEIIKRALRVYLINLGDYLSLKEELYAWEIASEKDIRNLEKLNE